MQNANVKSLKRFIFALREFDWQLTRLFARSTPEKQLSTKFHSQMYFAFQVRFRDARIRKDLLEIFWYSIFVSSRKVLRNSRFEKLVRVESSNRSSSNVESWERKKKKKRKILFDPSNARLCGKSRFDFRETYFQSNLSRNATLTDHPNQPRMVSRLGIYQLLPS